MTQVVLKDLDWPLVLRHLGPASDAQSHDAVCELIAKAIEDQIGPTEPTGLGAVVRDGFGRCWTRCRRSGYEWLCDVDAGKWAHFADLSRPIEVLSDGISR